MDALAELATKEYVEKEITVEPLFPRILVRLIPKEQVSKAGVIKVGGDKQNKPTHEGVVLKVYKPFWQFIRKKMDDWQVTRSPEVHLDENERVIRIWQECEVQPGDHVLFPFMAPGITPVWPLDGGRGMYRLIEEGHVLGKVKYEQQSTTTFLKEFLYDFEGGALPEESYEIVAKKIMEHADVIRKDLVAKTLSGE